MGCLPFTGLGLLIMWWISAISSGIEFYQLNSPYTIIVRIGFRQSIWLATENIIKKIKQTIFNSHKRRLDFTLASIHIINWQFSIGINSISRYKIQVKTNSFKFFFFQRIKFAYNQAILLWTCERREWELISFLFIWKHSQINEREREWETIFQTKFSDLIMECRNSRGTLIRLLVSIGNVSRDTRIDIYFSSFPLARF